MLVGTPRPVNLSVFNALGPALWIGRALPASSHWSSRRKPRTSALATLTRQSRHLTQTPTWGRSCRLPPRPGVHPRSTSSSVRQVGNATLTLGPLAASGRGLYDGVVSRPESQRGRSPSSPAECPRRRLPHRARARRRRHESSLPRDCGVAPPAGRHKIAPARIRERGQCYALQAGNRSRCPPATHEHHPSPHRRREGLHPLLLYVVR